MLKSGCAGITLIILLGLSSCVTNKPENPFVSPVYVTNQVKYILLPPEDIAVSLDMVQHISGIYGKQQFVMDTWVQADVSSITMMFFNNFGSNMGELLYDGKTVLLESPYFPSSLKPEYVIADFQFCFYRSDILAEALKDIGLILEINNIEIPGTDPLERRIILSGTKKIIEIEKTPKRVLYNNILRGYSYTLEGEFNGQ